MEMLGWKNKENGSGHQSVLGAELTTSRNCQESEKETRRGTLLGSWGQVRPLNYSCFPGCLFPEESQLDPRVRKQPRVVDTPVLAHWGALSCHIWETRALAALDPWSLLQLQPRSSFVPELNEDLFTVPGDFPPLPEVLGENPLVTGPTMLMP